MDLVPDWPLNKAHYFSRKADRLEKKGCFDDACEFHEQAVTYLLEALELTDNPLARESITLQSQFHSKKQELLKIKKQQVLALEEAVRVQKELLLRMMPEAKKSVNNSDGTLQKAIIRTFDEADSLLEILVQKKDKTSEKVTADLSQISGASKRPKDDSVVIEELRIVNYQLRSLITQLMAELTNSERQVAQLKSRVAELEATGTSTDNSSSRQAPAELSTLEDELPPLELPHFESPKR